MSEAPPALDTAYAPGSWVAVVGNGIWLLADIAGDPADVRRWWGLIRDGDVRRVIDEIGYYSAGTNRALVALQDGAVHWAAHGVAGIEIVDVDGGARSARAFAELGRPTIEAIAEIRISGPIDLTAGPPSTNLPMGYGVVLASALAVRTPSTAHRPARAAAHPSNPSPAHEPDDATVREPVGPASEFDDLFRPAVAGSGPAYALTVQRTIPVPPVSAPADVDPSASAPPASAPPLIDLSVFDPPVTEPPVVEPPVVEPLVVEPPVVEPSVVEPSVVEPSVVESSAVEPFVVEPSAVEPLVVEPPVAEPSVVEPALVEWAVDEPSVAGPSLVEPPLVEPPGTERPVVEPLVAGPSAVEPPRAERVAPARSWSDDDDIISDVSWALPQGTAATPPVAVTPAPARQPAAPTAPAAPPRPEGSPSGPLSGPHPPQTGTAPPAEVGATLLKPRRVPGPGQPALKCENGHLNPLLATVCRVCKRPVPLQEPEFVQRPMLGVLRLSTGDTFRLDRGAILGRSPGPPVLGDPDSPNHIVILGPDISRRHVEVRLDGWDVIVIDLNSSNGTMVAPPDGPPVMLDPGGSCRLQPDTVVSLSDTVWFRYEVTG